MTVETQYNVVKVNELREISLAQGRDEIVINDVDSSPLETKKIKVENLAASLKDYVLPIASEDVLGGIRVGDGLSINPVTGVLSNEILTFDDLDDVFILNPEAGQVIRYDGNQWVNQDEGGVTEIIAGNGLSGGGSDGVVTLHVNDGPGLSIVNDSLRVNAHKGIQILNDFLEAKVNPGLTISNNAITIVPGTGLQIDGGKVNFVPGLGLIASGASVKVDNGLGLRFEGNKLTATPGANLEYDINYNISAPIADSATMLIADEGGPGVVQLASIERTVEGSDVTTAATPMGVMKSIYERFQPVRPDPLTVTCSIACWPETSSTKATVCVGEKKLQLVGEADALTYEGKPALGTWIFKWYDVTDGQEVELTGDKSEVDDGPLNSGVTWADLTLNDFIITPVTGMRLIRFDVIFRDVFGMEYSAQSEVIQVVYKNAMKITEQPQNISMKNVSDKGKQFSTKVVVEPYEPALPWDSSKLSYRWTIWDTLIQSKNNPDMDFDFADWDTNELKITRTNDAGALLQLQCYIWYDEDPGQFPEIDTTVAGADVLDIDVLSRIQPPPLAVPFAEEQKDVRNRKLKSEKCLCTSPTGVVKEIVKEKVQQPVLTYYIWYGGGYWWYGYPYYRRFLYIPYVVNVRPYIWHGVRILGTRTTFIALWV